MLEVTRTPLKWFTKKGEKRYSSVIRGTEIVPGNGIHVSRVGHKTATQAIEYGQRIINRYHAMKRAQEAQ